MAHVLIDGESRILADVHDVLRCMDMTVGRLPDDSRARGRASRAECDVVLFLCEEDQDGTEAVGCHLKSVAPGEETPWQEEKQAPLLVIGRGRLAEIMGNQARQLIPEIGPGGSLLKQALCLCLENPPRIGSAVGERCNRDQQLHFLGHELRSPLTAIKTALEVVQGELWGATGPVLESETPAENRSGMRMLEIALRNVRRMHHTVEWSQNLLKFEDAGPESSGRLLSLEQLCRQLGRMTGREVRFQGADKAMEYEADLILLLAGEAIQAVRFGDPDLALNISLDTESAGPNRMRLELQRPGNEGLLGDSEQDLVVDHSREIPDFPELRRHLQRFADFLNPSVALDRAGGEIRVCGCPDEGLGLTLTFDLHPEASSRVTLAG